MIVCVLVRVLVCVVVCVRVCALVFACLCELFLCDRVFGSLCASLRAS